MATKWQSQDLNLRRPATELTSLDSQRSLLSWGRGRWRRREVESWGGRDWGHISVLLGALPVQCSSIAGACLEGSD